MQRLSDTMSAYRVSEHAEIRAAGVAALMSFPTQSFEAAIIAGFEDPSDLVRREALQLYGSNPFPSSVLENRFMAQIQDVTLDRSERSSIAHSLSQMEISAENRQIIKDVQTEIQNYYESLSEEELRALRSQ